MRIRLGRPDLSDYESRFDVPLAAGPLSVTFLGVSTLLIDDGTSALMTDGFFSRPGLLAVSTRRIGPDQGRIDACLDRAGVSRLEAVLPVHTHFDHALDSAVVAERTGASLVGGESAANIARGHGLPEERIRVAVPGDPMAYGPWSVMLVESAHCPPDRFPGAIDSPSYPDPGQRLQVRRGVVDPGPHSGGRSALVRAMPASSRCPRRPARRGRLSRRRSTRHPGRELLRTYWNETVRAVGARRVVITHWDDFFRPLDAPLRALPYAGDDLDATIRLLGGLAAEDGIPLQLPRVWEREDPWV